MFPKKRPTFPAAWEADRLALRAAHLMRICCFSKKDFSRFFGICLTEEDHDETKNVKRVTYIQGSLLVSLWLSKPFPDYQRQLRFSNEFPKKKKKKKKKSYLWQDARIFGSCLLQTIESFGNNVALYQNTEPFEKMMQKYMYPKYLENSDRPCLRLFQPEKRNK